MKYRLKGEWISFKPLSLNSIINLRNLLNMELIQIFRCCMNKLEYRDFVLRLQYFTKFDRKYTYENLSIIYWAEIY